MDMRRIWKMLNEGWFGTVFQVVLGVLIAYFAYKLLGLILHTPTPLVAVVSTSMQHENEETTHYSQLEKYLGYNRSYIDSWPISSGFGRGDMLIIVGSDNYEIGDVIVYRASSVSNKEVCKLPSQQPPALPTDPIIHRIIYKNPDGTYQTKGDANLIQFSYECRIRKEQIYGKAILFPIPKLGYPKIILTEMLEMLVTGKR
jgi:signal peptidase I